MTSHLIDPGASAPRVCVFTIVSRNYLHYALNLMESVAIHMAGAERVIVLCDSAEGLDREALDVPLLDIDALNIPHVDRMVYQYTILELNTAIKPFAFAALFERMDCDRVVYFDPDIQLFGSGEALVRRLDDADVVLTPHLTDILDDRFNPTDLAILQSGSYNLGFLALRRSANSARLLQWWQQKLQRDCVVDIPRGLFTDQKWMDLVPGMFERVCIERHPGWNVAYWNLLHRPIVRADGGFEVHGRPLFFFHFSGWNPASKLISKHQDRFTLDQCSAAVQQLFAIYDANVIRLGRERFATQPYAFACLGDGTVLPDCARQVIRQQIDWRDDLPDFRSEAGTRFLIGFLTAPVDDQMPPLSRLALQLHRSRADLQAAFPDVHGAHRRAFFDWFNERAGIEAGVVGRLSTAGLPAAGPLPTRAASAPTDVAPPASEAVPAATRAVAGSTPAAGSRLFRAAYRLAWTARHALRPLSTPKFRNRVRSYLVKRAYSTAPAPAPAVSAPPAAVAGEAASFGVTVIGYVHAESGVGESARSTLRALAHTDVPHACHDFRAGNVSRMGEDIDAALDDGRHRAVSLFHVNADQLPLARTLLDERYFTRAYRIGFWAWELERFPTEWHGAFDHVDEVWVPSTFCQRAIAAVSPVPVLCMPHSIDVPEHTTADRSRFGLAPDSVVFLAMADMMSMVERKNPLGAVEAFVSAFGDGKAEVELVVKISNSSRNPEGLARLKDVVRGHPAIHLIDDYLDRAELNCLIDSCDCFVSLHRSEGFGLVIAEAMARGKVVIATGWSGNMDFMTLHNSMPVDFRLEALQQDCGPYRRGERWAEPCQRDAADKMLRVAGDARLRQEIGLRARHDCLEMLAPKVVAKQMQSRLHLLRAAKGL